MNDAVLRQTQSLIEIIRMILSRDGLLDRVLCAESTRPESSTEIRTDNRITGRDLIRH